MEMLPMLPEIVLSAQDILCPVEKIRPILYGVADYAQIRKKNAFEEFFSGTDIALKPRLDRWPDIAHAALIEMKYVKAGDPVPTKEK